MAASHHGNTPAAWTAVIIMFVGFCVGGVFTVAAQPLGVLAGGLVIAVGAVVGWAMRAAGMGQPKGHGKPQRMMGA
ncbi:HGxxPAAW family protein [Streptomyces oceani]|uniref:Uncharacterized protein n=1 Tax=Streptomyces oceani TaxID=1075402 RepID=A0A1E7JZB5_9ACTN|nr:HGxxPAAW family protein [Streptomyces oceani]OEU97019.1 hypothetical protein AN216_17320 [Streptomyces oceani]